MIAATDTANELLAEVKAIATARLKACNVAARHAGLTIVDSKRLEALESLAKAVELAFSKDRARMTRDYQDVLAKYPDTETYNGQRFLIRRDLGEAIYHKLRAVGTSERMPGGCLAGDIWE